MFLLNPRPEARLNRTGRGVAIETYYLVVLRYWSMN